MVALLALLVAINWKILLSFVTERHSAVRERARSKLFGLRKFESLMTEILISTE